MPPNGPINISTPARHILDQPLKGGTRTGSISSKTSPQEAPRFCPRNLGKITKMVTPSHLYTPKSRDWACLWESRRSFRQKKFWPLAAHFGGVMAPQIFKFAPSSLQIPSSEFAKIFSSCRGGPGLRCVKIARKSYEPFSTYRPMSMLGLCSDKNTRKRSRYTPMNTPSHSAWSESSGSKADIPDPTPAPDTTGNSIQHPNSLCGPPE